MEPHFKYSKQRHDRCYSHVDCRKGVTSHNGKNRLGFQLQETTIKSNILAIDADDDEEEEED